jgi:diguanylate cyclase (GGDEF)-like protein
MVDWKRITIFTSQVVAASLVGVWMLIWVIYNEQGSDVLWFELQVSSFITITVASVIGFFFALQRERLQIALRQLEEMVDRDILTGLASRARFFRFVGPLVEPVASGRARSAPTVSALLLIDADHFKAINDRHGHQVGDEVLAEIGVRLKGLVRSGEIAARLGGEEFALFLPEVTPSEAVARAESICRLMAQRPVRIGDQTTIRATVSIGVALHDVGQSLVALISAADRALYSAKSAGRDRVVVAPSGWLPPSTDSTSIAA